MKYLHQSLAKIVHQIRMRMEKEGDYHIELFTSKLVEIPIFKFALPKLSLLLFSLCEIICCKKRKVSKFCETIPCFIKWC